MTLYKWSQTAANNATADSSINWQEGQAPSSVNDSARAMMASVAKHRDDIAGAIVTGGTATAYTVASYEAFDTLDRLNGQIIAFSPHATNGAMVTLNVDSLGPKPMRSAPSVELPVGTLIQGTPYLALYNNSDGVFYLHGFYGNPYNVPLGAGLDYWGATTPNSAFAFPAGQAISRNTYASLFALIGNTYGAGDGSTTFNLPDKTGRVSAMKEVSATRLTTTGSNTDGATLGATGGAQNGTILQSNLPAVTLVTSVIDPGHTHTNSKARLQGTNVFNINTAAAFGGNNTTSEDTGMLTISTATTGITASTALGGSGIAFKLVQPTIVCNYIMRIV